jgi:nucleoid-associated protein YgaU
MRWIIATASVVVLAAFLGAALLSRAQGPLGQSSKRQIVTASVEAAAAKPVTTMPTIGAGIEPVANGASEADVNHTAAPSASGPSEAQAGSMSTSAGPAPAMTSTIKPVITPEPSSAESPPLPADEKTGAIVRSDGKIEVVVRRGDSLIQLCHRIYGRCSSETLRRVLEINPQIRSKSVILSGHVVVFQPAPGDR